MDGQVRKGEKIEVGSPESEVRSSKSEVFLLPTSLPD